MDVWVGKLAVITGASSGIGEALSRVFANKGVNVLGLARREDRLRKIQSSLAGSAGSFYFMKCDVTKEDDMLKSFKYAEEKLGGVDILINNAGIIKCDGFHEIATEDIRRSVDVNLVAVVMGIRESLKSMRKHKRNAHIINISSIVAINTKIVDMPINLYPATKLALRGLSDTLRLEIARTKQKIRLTTIYPGLVNETELNESSGLDREELAEIMANMRTEDVVNSIIYALSVPLHVQIEELVITGA